MPSTAARHEEQQERWDELARDPLLSTLPYKVETNQRGQIVLSPHQAEHSYTQGDIIGLLYEHAEEGRPFPEFPLTTDGGVKVPDVVWVTEGRREEMDQTGDPPTLAPEICVEIMSESNDWDEMHDKRALYRKAGAEEVWVVDGDGTIRFFGEEELDHSNIVPGFPDRM